MVQIEVDQEIISAFCKRNHIQKLAFFGSVLTDQFNEDSDVDVLVEFDLEHIPGLFEIVDMEMELSDIIARKADMRTPEDLSRYFRDEVIKHAVVQYAA